MSQKISFILSTKVTRNYDIITILPTTYQNKTEMAEKKKTTAEPGLFIRSGNLYHLYTNYLSKIFGGTV